MSYYKNEKPKYNLDYNFNANVGRSSRRDELQGDCNDKYVNSKNLNSIQPLDKSVNKLTKIVSSDKTRNQTRKVIDFSSKIDVGVRVLSLKLSRAQQVSGLIKTKSYNVLYEVIGQIENVDYQSENEMVTFYIRDGHCVQKSVFCNIDQIEFDINLNVVYRFVGFFNLALKSCFQCFKLIPINDEEFRIIKLFEVQSEKQLQLMLSNISEI